MENQIIPAVLTVAGIIFLIRNIGMLFNHDKLVNYVQTSPKAKLWVNKFGEEKAISLTKSIFLPLGTAMCVAFIVIGIRTLAIINGVS